MVVPSPPPVRPVAPCRPPVGSGSSSPGDTLWSIAEAVDPAGDVRPLVDRLATEAGGPRSTRGRPSPSRVTEDQGPLSAVSTVRAPATRGRWCGPRIRWRAGRGYIRERCGARSARAMDDKVVDSRSVEEGGAIRRRRECLACGRRFTTYERLEEVPFVVVKRSGQREPFDRSKIVAGVVAAAKNRPVSASDMDGLAADVEEELRLSGHEVSAQQIGLAVLDRLQIVRRGHLPAVRQRVQGFLGRGGFRTRSGAVDEGHRPQATSSSPGVRTEADRRGLAFAATGDRAAQVGNNEEDAHASWCAHWRRGLPGTERGHTGRRPAGRG